MARPRRPKVKNPKTKKVDVRLMEYGSWIKNIFSAKI